LREDYPEFYPIRQVSADRAITVSMPGEAPVMIEILHSITTGLAVIGCRGLRQSFSSGRRRLPVSLAVSVDRRPIIITLDQR
jgi:hypothetical protein